MGPRHGTQIDWFSVISISYLTITLIISETVFHADNNPTCRC